MPSSIENQQLCVGGIREEKRVKGVEICVLLSIVVGKKTKKLLWLLERVQEEASTVRLHVVVTMNVLSPCKYF